MRKISLPIILLLGMVISYSAGNGVAFGEQVDVAPEEAKRLAVELADLSASFVYNLDEQQLQHILAVVLDNNNKIKAVTITDAVSEELFFTYFLQDGKMRFGKAVPASSRQYTHGSANIVYRDMLLGRLDLYYDGSLAAVSSSGTGDDFNRQVLLLGGLFIVLLLTLFVIYKALSRHGASDIHFLAFGSAGFAYLVMASFAIILTLSVAVSWFVLEQNSQRIQTRLSDSLHQSISVLENNLFEISRLRTAVQHRITDENRFQKLLAKLRLAQQSAGQSEITAVNRQLEALLDQSDYRGNRESLLVVSATGEMIFSLGETFSPSRLDKHPSSPFSRALAGEYTLMSPHRRYEQLSIKDCQCFYLVAPVAGPQGEVTAVSFFGVDPRSVIAKELGNYQFGASGEVLALNREGLLLSGNRFELPVQRWDIINDLAQAGQPLFDSTWFGNGKVDEPVTELIDYRRQPVFADVHWNADLNIGFIAKIDQVEAFQSHVEFRRGVIVIVMLMAAFTIPSVLFTLHMGKRANDSLRGSRHELIRRLGHAAEFKDNETALHITRMSHYTRILASKLDVTREWQDLIFTASPMHDVGKIGVPDAILQKPGKLTEQEWVIMRRHPEFGADILGHHNSDLLKMARDIAIAHHEKWDGSGYPNQLGGEAIPLAARLVAIADVFDALTSERPYKRAWAIEEAVTHIVSESGKHFDPELVKVFTKSIPEFKVIHHRYADTPNVTG
ncbi:HD domain-containing phosphohydrolase [Photobacterium obscurum]|uniref:HD domain-containing phosphohydrolase n=1 Tax=Photobacterium obscurum TaxID=2829490 RepID=UPI00389A6B1D